MREIHIERVLLGVLADHGLGREGAALMVDAMLRGSKTAHRALARIAEASVSMTVPCPILPDGTPDRSWSGDPVAVATVPLGGGYAWSAGELLDPRRTVPSTIALAAIGRPSGTLLRHAGIDAEATMGAPVHDHGVMSVPMEAVALRVPRWPVGRLRHWTLLMRQRRSEKPSGNRITATFAACSALIALAIAVRVGVNGVGDPLTAIGTATMGLTWIVITLLAMDSATGRLLSESLMRRETSHEMIAARAHREEMDALRKARGFDDEGRPLT